MLLSERCSDKIDPTVEVAEPGGEPAATPTMPGAAAALDSPSRVVKVSRSGTPMWPSKRSRDERVLELDGRLILPPEGEVVGRAPKRSEGSV